MLNEANPHLKEFLENSRKVKDEIISNPDMIGRIKGKLLIDTVHRGFYIPNSWDKGVYMPLEPGRFGLKKRSELFDMQVEAAVTADIFRPDLPLSPFVIILGEKPVSDHVYIVKDFGELQPVKPDTFHKQLNDIVRHLIQKGYMSDDWENMFSFRTDGKLVMMDLNCSNMDNKPEIIYGVNSGEGEFTRLSEIWNILKSPEYRIDLK